MAISVPTLRDKITTVNSSPTNLAAAAPIEVDSSDSIFLGVQAASPIDPPSFTVSACSLALGNINVATTGNFDKVKVGDVVTGTGIDTQGEPVTVTAKTSPTVIQLSSAATASGVNTLTFNPPAITPTYYGIELQHGASKDKVNITAVILHRYDGTLGGTIGTTSNSSQRIILVPAPATPGGVGALSIDIEAFMTNLRVPKSP